MRERGLHDDATSSLMTACTKKSCPALANRSVNPRLALSIAGLCWLSVAFIAWSVMRGGTVSFDEAGLFLWRNADLSPIGSAHTLEIVRDITSLGGVFLRHLFAIAAILSLIMMGMRRTAWHLTLIVSLGWTANSGLKALFSRPRPDIVPHLMGASGNSFPSGHSFNAAVVYVSIALIFAAMSQRTAVRYLLIASALLLSIMIAWSRVWLGVHWPTDVIAGWLGGVGWAFFMTAILGRRRT